MSAVAVTRTYTVPRGATGFERFSIRIADAVTRWATARAEHRQDRHETMLAALKEQQTRRSDPRAVDHLLAQMGLPRK